MILKNGETIMKKRILKTCSVGVLAILCLSLCAGMVGCGSVKVDSIEIVAPESGEVRLGESFSLDFNVTPQEAKEDVKIKWSVDNENRLSVKDGNFEALSCGSAKVTASASDLTDEIELKVVPPEGYTLHSGEGYTVILPSSFQKNPIVNSWKSNSYQYFNFVFTEEELNENYFKATGSMFQATYETTFSLLGMKVNFTKPVTAKKETRLGVERVRVESEFESTALGITDKLYQTQMIFNNKEKNLSCCLTVTYNDKEYDDSIKEIGEFVLSQFLPI